ncbi:double-strand break repair protein AddB [Afipia sp. TerB]
MHVFNVPSSAPFLCTVITALVEGRLIEGFDARRDPDRLADVTLYLPTRRAGRMAREIFLDVMQADAVLLPRIVPLGNVDEDEIEFAQAQSDPGFSALDIPPALEGLERRLTLAQLVSAWVKQLKPDDPASAPLVAGGPASTLGLADDLARLMDDMATRGVDWRALDGLVPDDLDKYWKLTLDFLKIAREWWPEHLQNVQAIDPAIRRDRLIEAEAARLKANQAGPVIAAGSTGSMPATAKFLHAIAQLPQGAVILPGLDTDLDEASWHSIGGIRDKAGKSIAPPLSSHPQFALHGLLARFGIARKDVVPLASPQGRELLVSEAMRPATSSALWAAQLAKPEIAARISHGINHLAVIEAPTPEMEALAIAVAMREAHEQNRTAALVTPDRALARRVMAALDRWSLPYDDSGGDSLMDTPAGLFARLAAQTVAEDLAPAPLLALLKHPLLRLGTTENACRDAIHTLEVALLRGTRPQAGTPGLARDFARFREELGKLRRDEISALHRSEPRAQLDDARLDKAQALIEALTAALKPLDEMRNSKPVDFAALVARHRAVLSALSADDAGTAQVFEGPDGDNLAAAFDELTPDSAENQPAETGFLVPLADYPEVFRAAFADRIVRRAQAPGAALRIYGLLEARLTHCERVILGGLIEGVWPPQPRIDPWLSRPMRHDLGLDLPERRIGLSAHDFAQLLGHDEVILTHAAKSGGAPAVASRFLHRLEAVAGKPRWDIIRERGSDYIRFAETLDRPETVTPVPQPAPKPPRALRPLNMSVTEIEDWLRDPYTIFAKRILKLAPLDPVDMPLSAADRGSAIHEAIGDFTQRFSDALPPNISTELIDIGAKHFAPLMERPEARALWWPRFQRIAAWFAGWEIARRDEMTGASAEIQGRIAIPLGGDRVFRLSARADRIEHRLDRTYAIVDYKTGQPPTGKQVFMGLSPQLTLEAAILRNGGFDHIPAASSVSELVYVKLSGNNPPGEERVLELRVKSSDPSQFPDDAADQALQKLEALIRQFENENQSYRSLALSMWSNRYGRYDDLARIKEWSATGGTGGDEA